MTVDVQAAPESFTLDPKRAAVVVVDMQNDFGAFGGMFDRAGIDISAIRSVVEPTSRVLEAARRVGIKVIYLKMEFRPDLSDSGGASSPNWLKHAPLGFGKPFTAPDGSPGGVLVQGVWNTEIIPELAPVPGDVLVSKHRYSGFYETDLDVILKGLGVKQLVFTGCTTSVCVESTVRDAMFRDYACLVLSDCVAEPIGNDLVRTNHEASLTVIQTLFGWVSDSTALIEALASQPLAAR
jgi:ureidoacrylate peracid hydrolase